jgi:hypothetical protein
MTTNISLSEFEYFHVIVHKDEVDTFSVEPVANALYEIKALGEKANGRLVLSFDGYDDDVRELAEIPELRIFIKFIDKCFPYWFFFLDRNIKPYGSPLLLITNCLVDVQVTASMSDSKKRIFGLNKEQFSNFLDIHFHFLNELIDELGLSEAENRKITDEIFAIYQPNFNAII